jgi:hypothetical protein
MDTVIIRSDMAQDCMKGTAPVMKAVLEAKVIRLVNRVEKGSSNKPVTVESNAIGRTPSNTVRPSARSPTAYGTIKPW